MEVVFCTTCKERLHHVLETLPANIRANPGAKFVLVNYRDPLFGFTNQRPSFDLIHAISEGQLVVYDFPGVGKFQMGHAKNLAHRCGLNEGADVLVNLDADNFAGEAFTEWLRSERAANPDAFFWARMVPHVMPRGINGRIAVTATQFLTSGGYDERFTTWSHDDKDFNQRLRRLGYPAREIPAHFLNAVRHNDKMRFREYPEMRRAAAAGYDGLSGGDGASDATVVNFGRIGCGAVYRNFSRQPTELAPVPTRVFGIGMHKTGTKSLDKALRMLGLDSAHWLSAKWAGAIYAEMLAYGRSVTLERHYALSDLPMPLIFRELDKAYPGSKFILTLRDETKWIASIEKHFSRASNPYRGLWDTDGATHTLHRALYGRADFDAQTMIERYRRHNAEVRGWFRERLGDLLEINLDNGEDVWAKLCAFLGKPHPRQPYPHANKSR
jgi:hypothetical protein